MNADTGSSSEEDMECSDDSDEESEESEASEAKMTTAAPSQANLM